MCAVSKTHFPQRIFSENVPRKSNAVGGAPFSYIIRKRGAESLAYMSAHVVSCLESSAVFHGKKQFGKFFSYIVPVFFLKAFGKVKSPCASFFENPLSSESVRIVCGSSVKIAGIVLPNSLENLL